MDFSSSASNTPCSLRKATNSLAVSSLVISCGLVIMPIVLNIGLEIFLRVTT
jgi:hypothetical protein